MAVFAYKKGAIIRFVQEQKQKRDVEGKSLRIVFAKGALHPTPYNLPYNLSSTHTLPLGCLDQSRISHLITIPQP